MPGDPLGHALATGPIEVVEKLEHMPTGVHQTGLRQLLFKELQQLVHAPRMGQPLWILQGLRSRDHLGHTCQRLEEPWTTEVPLVIFYGHGILDGLLLVARKGLWRAIIARNILSTHLLCTLRQLAQMHTQLHLDQTEPAPLRRTQSATRLFATMKLRWQQRTLSFTCLGASRS